MSYLKDSHYFKSTNDHGTPPIVSFIVRPHTSLMHATMGSRDYHGDHTHVVFPHGHEAHTLSNTHDTALVYLVYLAPYEFVELYEFVEPPYEFIPLP